MCCHFRCMLREVRYFASEWGQRRRAMIAKKPTFSGYFRKLRQRKVQKRFQFREIEMRATETWCLPVTGSMVSITKK